MKKKNLSKLIVLSVLLGVLGCNNDVRAESWYGTASGGYTTTAPATSSNMILNVNPSDNPNGAYIYGGYTITGEANGNQIFIDNNGTFGYIRGGMGLNGASNNEVSISGDGTYGNGTYLDIYGGYVTYNGSANNNTVKINGGYFNATIVGGAASDSGDSKNNTVIISGGVFGENTEIKVGKVSSGTSTSIGNKFVLKNWEIIVNRVDGVQKFDFVIGDNIAAGDIMLDTNVVTYLGNCEINIALDGELDKFARGEYITVVNNCYSYSSDPNDILNGATTNIYNDDVNGTAYIGKYKFAVEDGKLLFGNFIGDYYVCDNSSGTEELVYESESYSTGSHNNVCGNVDSIGNINNRYSNNVVHIVRGGFGGSGYLMGLSGATNSLDTTVVKDNIVYFDDGANASGNFAGGYSSAGADITGNMVVIKNNKSKLSQIYGGWNQGNGNAGGDSYETGNKVLISKAMFNASSSVVGGYAFNGNANFNIVKMGLNDGEITGTIENVYGGRSFLNNGETNNNKVVLYSGVYKNIYGACNLNGYANENYVQVSGEIQQKLYGGLGKLQANSNEVCIEESTFGTDCLVYGGYVEGSNVGTANDNTVEISESTTTGNLMVYGGYSKTGSANGNQVIVLSGDFSTGTVKIIGGGTTDNTKETNNNIVDIAGGTFGSNVSLIGGQGASTGNKFEYRVSGQTFNSVRDFQEMNFYLPTDTDVTGATPLMTVTNEVTVDAVVNVYNPNNIALTDGDIVTLIHDTSGDKFQDTFTEMQGGNVLGQTMNISGTKFVNQYAELGFDDDTNPTKLQMKVQSAPEVTSDEDALKAPVEGMAAAAQAVNTVSDLASTQGMENMTNVTANSETAESFAASNIGKQKLKSGSHVDVHGYALVAGVAKKTTNDNGDKVTTGLFFEYGNNDFDTYQDNGYHGEGSSVSRGGGLMWKYESINGSYYEGMLHAGRVKTNWKSNELNGGYETNSIYYGGAATYGYKLMMEEREQLKFYASYMYGHTAGSDVNVGGADYHFDSVKSHRTRLGVRYMHSDLMEQNKVRPYIGFAWEHEFDGEARADVSVGTSSISAPAPTMKGNTGIMDIGCTWDTGRWTVSLGGEMYVGKRRGWNGMLSFTLNF